MKPVIGITMGDAAGIGAEIIVKSLTHKNIYEECQPIVIGDAKILSRAVEITKSNVTIRSIQKIEEAQFQFGTIECIDLNLLPSNLPFGKVSAEAGNAAFQYIKKLFL